MIICGWSFYFRMQLLRRNVCSLVFLSSMFHHFGSQLKWTTFLLFVFFKCFALISNDFKFDIIAKFDEIWFFESNIFLESGLDDFVSLQSGNKDIEYPEEDEETRSRSLCTFGSSELSTDGWVPSNHQSNNGNDSFNTKYRHGETQTKKKLKLFINI